MIELAGKVVWVTGASSGIGRELCAALDRLGASLILSSRRQTELENVRLGLNFPDRHRSIAFDLSEPLHFAKTVKAAWQVHQRIDMLVNNGGISQRGLAKDTSIDVDRRVMEVDYFGTIGLTKALLPKLIKQRSGTLINIASISGKIGVPERTAYCAAKHALIGFMNSLRAEVAENNIKVINFCPGYVHTNLSRNALTGDMQPHGVLDRTTANGMSVNEFVQCLLKQLNSGKSEVIIAKGKSFWGYQLNRLFPNIYHKVLLKVYRRKG